MNAENNMSTTNTPNAIKKNNILREHGQQGWLIVRLQRNNTFGWISFFIVLVFLMLYMVASIFKPVPVLAVDEKGVLLGKFEYLDASARTESQIVAGAEFFLGRYLSLNSATVYSDISEALNMMDVKLRKEKLEEMKTTNYLVRIEDAKAHSYLEFYKGKERPTIISQKKLYAAVRLRGNIIIHYSNPGVRVKGKKAGPIEKPFDITVDLKIVPRTTFATSGLVITTMRNN